MEEAKSKIVNFYKKCGFNYNETNNTVYRKQIKNASKYT